MPIVIMKCSYRCFPAAHAVWAGDMRSAKEWCQKATDKKHNVTTEYWPVSVKQVKQVKP